jgi:hypothetical protein
MNIVQIFKNCSPSTTRKGGRHSAKSKTFHDEGAELQGHHKFKLPYFKLSRRNYSKNIFFKHPAFPYVSDQKEGPRRNIAALRMQQVE